jgi:hypothetical protein
MKLRTLALACATLALPFTAIANPTSNWTGVWESKLDGVTAVTLTLAEDAGTLDGTIVFHAVSREGGQPHSISIEPHTLMNPHLEGNILSFQVRRGNGSAEVLNMTVELNNPNKAQFHCTNCGPEGTKAELDRMQ